MRAFLPWTSHLLPIVAARMVADCAAKNPASHDADLSEWLVVVRGRAASRRLLGLLAAEAQRAGRALIPPRITTPGQLDGEMFGRPQNVAGTLTQRLAWAAALERAPDDLLAHVWHAPEGRDRSASRRNLAGFLERTWRELSVSGTDFAGAFEILARLVPDVADIEQPRWLALQQLLDHHRAILGEWGLVEPAAWRKSLLSAGRAPDIAHVALVGIVELPPVLVSLLGLLKNDPLIFIHAPESEAAGFDAWGRLQSAHWAKRGCHFANGEIHIVRGVREQAARCAEIIRAWTRDGLATSAITVAVPESAALAALQQGVADAGIAVRTAEGRPLSRSSALVLLTQLADFLDRDANELPSYESTAALARHPDLRLAGNYSANQLDTFFENHLPARIDSSLGKKDDGTESNVETTLRKLESLAVIRSGNFAGDVTQLLLTVYGERNVAPHTDEGRTLIPALESVRKTIDEIERLPDDALAQFSAADLLRLLAEIAGSGETPEPEQPGAVELAGWLEAASDDAPALIVTSVFDGSLPEGAGAEPLLLDSLRERLGLPCRATRFARDQFTLHSVWQSRKNTGRFALIAPRRTAEGTPARPSRLLLAAHEDRELAARLLALVAETHGTQAPQRGGAGLRPPEPDAERMRAFRTFRVTGFRTYLASPRLFYFQHVRRLKVQDDSADELDGGAFGSAIHSVLEAFAERHVGGVKELTSDKIESETIAALHDFMGRRYGRHPLPPVRAQIFSLEERLRAFAVEQARLFAEGWEIAYVEKKGAAVEVPFIVPGAPDDVRLKGRIDRVDRHRDGRLRVMDYKTSSTPKQPTIAHFSEQKNEWRDLQLPLYVKLLPQLGLACKIPDPGEELELVYFNLPPKRDDARISKPFDSALISAAWERAQQIVAEVCSGAGCREVGNVSAHEDPVFHALCGTNGLPTTDEEED
jgi:ATP-dependent helicase/nuclease subunit B